jgi:Hsp20/alpha crystallin family
MSHMFQFVPLIFRAFPNSDGNSMRHGCDKGPPRRFNLADYVTVKGASLEDGLLQIELERELPEAMKPRRIEIQTGKALGKGDKVRTIEHSKIA